MVGNKTELFWYIPKRVNTQSYENQEKILKYKYQHLTIFSVIFDLPAVHNQAIRYEANHSIEGDGPAEYRDDRDNRGYEDRDKVISRRSRKLKSFVAHPESLLVNLQLCCCIGSLSTIYLTPFKAAFSRETNNVR
jgi:hypothetical protein